MWRQLLVVPHQDGLPSKQESQDHLWWRGFADFVDDDDVKWPCCTVGIPVIGSCIACRDTFHIHHLEVRIRQILDQGRRASVDGVHPIFAQCMPPVCTLKDGLCSEIQARDSDSSVA